MSLEAVYRVLVGKETAPHLRPAGLLQQALVVRRKTILRLSQLLRRQPHATNRYLDLLSFAAAYDAAVFDRFRASLGAAPADVDGVFAKLRGRRPSTAAIPIGVLLAALVLLVGVVAGLALPSPQQSADPDPPTPTPGPVVSSDKPSPTQTGPTPEQVLLSHLPADLQNNKCEEGTPDPARGQLAVAANCNATGSAGPNTVDYTSYRTTSAMQADFDSRARAESAARCSAGTGPETWTRQNGAVGGPIACYVFQNENVVMWGDNDTAILGYASDPVRPHSEILTWWQAHPIVGN